MTWWISVKIVANNNLEYVYFGRIGRESRSALIESSKSKQFENKYGVLKRADMIIFLLINFLDK